MMEWLFAYIQYAMLVVFAMIASGLVLWMAVALGMMVHALYKGLTDETWR